MARMMTYRAGIWVLLGALLIGNGNALSQAVPAAPPRCITVNMIESSEIVSDSEILLALYGGDRIRMALSTSCPQLKYQNSFTYDANGGRICAGEDRIITRSGDACLVDAFRLVDPEPDPPADPE